MKKINLVLISLAVFSSLGLIAATANSRVLNEVVVSTAASGYASDLYNKPSYGTQTFELTNAKSGLIGTTRKVKARVFGTSQLDARGYTEFKDLVKGSVTQLHISDVEKVSYGTAPGLTQLNIANQTSYATSTYVWGTWIYQQ